MINEKSTTKANIQNDILNLLTAWSTRLSAMQNKAIITESSIRETIMLKSCIRELQDVVSGDNKQQKL